MTRMPMTRIFRLLPLLCVAALAACEPNGEKEGTLTGPMPMTPPPIVVRDQARHLVLDLPRSGQIGDAEWNRYVGFLHAAAAGRPEAVHLTIAGDPSLAVEDALARRAAAMGIRRISADVRPAGGARMKVELVARTYVAVLPNCPQTEHLNIIDGDNKVSSDWGCSTVSNLELMVADPHDLIEGQGGGETDAVLTTAAITRLQTDKVKKLEGPSTTAPVANASGTAQ